MKSYYKVTKYFRNSLENIVSVKCWKQMSKTLILSAPSAPVWAPERCNEKNWIVCIRISLRPRLSNNGVITFWKVHRSLSFLTFAYNILYCDILNIILVHCRGVFQWTFLGTDKKIKVKLCKWSERALPFEIW